MAVGGRARLVAGAGLAGGPPDGRALGAAPRGAVGGPAGAGGVVGRRHHPQAARAPAALSPRPGYGARSARTSSSRRSEAAIHGRPAGSPEASASSRCSLVSPYSSPVATRTRSTGSSSPNALPGSTPAP